MRVLASLLCLWLGACAAPSPEPQEPPAPAPPPPLGPLVMLVPEGATLVVRAEPSRLLAAPAVRRAVAPLLLTDRARRAIERVLGVPLEDVHELVVAEHGERGRQILLRGPFDAPAAVRRMAERMTPVEVSSEEPLVRRAGFVGRVRREAVALRSDVLMVADDLADVVAHVASAALAPRKERSWTPALASPEALALLAETEGAPLALHAPQPLDLPEGYGTSLLLAREEALAATLTPVDGTWLQLEVGLRGEFPEGAVDNFRALVTSVARSELGMAVGLGDGLPSLRVQTEPGRVLIRMRVRAGSLARGVRILVGPDVGAVVEGAHPAQK